MIFQPALLLFSFFFFFVVNLHDQNANNQNIQSKYMLINVFPLLVLPSLLVCFVLISVLFLISTHADECEKFNPSVDRASGYRTRQILCVPILSTEAGRRKSIVGAIQVVNRMHDTSTERKTDVNVKKDAKTPFNSAEETLLTSLAEKIAEAVARCQWATAVTNKEKSVHDRVARLEAACASSEVMSQAICVTYDMMLKSSVSGGPSKHDCLLSVCASIKNLIQLIPAPSFSSSSSSRKTTKSKDREIQIRQKLKVAASGSKGVNWRKLFRFYDSDNSGALRFEEFKHAIRTDGNMPSRELGDKDLRFLFNRIDEDAGGEIEIEEFMVWLSDDESGSGGGGGGATDHPERLKQRGQSLSAAVEKLVIIRVYMMNPDTNELEFVVCDKPQGVLLGPPTETIIDVSSNSIVAASARSMKSMHYDATAIQTYDVDISAAKMSGEDGWKQNPRIQKEDIGTVITLPIFQKLKFNGGSTDASSFFGHSSKTIVGIIEIMWSKESVGNNFVPEDLEMIQNYLSAIGGSLQQAIYLNHYNGKNGMLQRKGGTDMQKLSRAVEASQQSLANALDFGPLLLRETSTADVQKKLGESHALLFGAESVCLWTLQGKGRLVPFGTPSSTTDGHVSRHRYRHHLKKKKHHHHHYHHNYQNPNDHDASQAESDWMQADTGPAGHCLSTGDIVNLTQASGTYGRNCGVNIVSPTPIVVSSVLCCPVEVKGRRVGVLQILNKTSGSFDLASDVQTVQLVSMLLAEWMNRWDMAHQLRSLELACSTLRSAARKKLADMRKHLDSMGKQMSNQHMLDVNQIQSVKSHWDEEKSQWKKEKHNWQVNSLHAKELEQLHRLDHVLRHGILSRAMRQLVRLCWHSTQDEMHAIQNKKVQAVSGLKKIQDTFRIVSGEHKMKRYQLRWGFEMLRRFVVPTNIRMMMEDQERESSRKREILRMHANRIREATATLKRYSRADDELYM